MAKEKRKLQIPKPVVNNSAGRLIAILEPFSDQQPITETVARLFGNEATSAIDKQKAAIEFLRLLDVTYQEFLRDMETSSTMNDANRGAFLRGLAALSEVVYPTSLNGAIRRLTASEISLLQVCSTFITAQPEIPESELDEIRASIDELRAAVNGSDIPDSLRKSLLELVRMADDLVNRHDIYGARGMRKAFRKLLVDAAELYESNAEVKDAAKASGSIWNKLLSMCHVVERVTATAVNLTKVISWIAPRLSGDVLPPDEL